MKRGKKEPDIPCIPFTKVKFDFLGMMRTDPMGSYTGVPLLEGDDIPVQDADDL
jgi:hypothetical protein